MLAPSRLGEADVVLVHYRGLRGAVKEAFRAVVGDDVNDFTVLEPFGHLPQGVEHRTFALQGAFGVAEEP